MGARQIPIIPPATQWQGTARCLTGTQSAPEAAETAEEPEAAETAEEPEAAETVAAEAMGEPEPTEPEEAEAGVEEEQFPPTVKVETMLGAGAISMVEEPPEELAAPEPEPAEELPLVC